ncbi:barstar family protein [Novosphingobium guangzhouense]|nr:barstar family protein [Novosphingobium guangzhouense]
MDHKLFTIDGAAITGIAALYAQINAVFMADEDWKIGESLDALNDLLHGGFGAIAGADAVTIRWKDIARTRAALGAEATADLLRQRSATRTMFNGARIADQLAALEAGGGVTYFDIVMDIFADHPAIVIEPA